jgi:hypothetical protein
MSKLSSLAKKNARLMGHYPVVTQMLKNLALQENGRRDSSQDLKHSIRAFPAYFPPKTDAISLCTGRRRIKG